MHIGSILFYFRWDHWASSGYFENRISLKPVLGSEYSLANYIAVCEEAYKNIVYDFSYFAYHFLSKGNLLDFDFYWSNSRGITEKQSLREMVALSEKPTPPREFASLLKSDFRTNAK